MIEAQTMDISHKDLKLAVIHGEVDLSSLLIFEEKDIYIPEFDLNIYAGIIGTSHFIQMKSKSGSLFTEILACNANEVQSNNSMFLDSIQQIEQPVEKNGAFGHYIFDYKLIPYHNSKDLVNNWTKDPIFENPLFYLEYAFDVIDVSLQSSKTILAVFQQGKSVLIRTVHEYQEENTSVLSQSILTL